MRITSVTSAVVEANFDYTFVRVHTNEDLHGTGECFPAPALPQMISELGELLVGLDPRHPTPLWKKLMIAVSGCGSASRAGIAYNAISGIEAALWDLYGKTTGEPIVRLLGGSYRSEVAVYADLHGGGQLQSISPLSQYRTPFWLSESGETEKGTFYWEAAEGEAVSLAGTVARCTEAVERFGFQKIKLDVDVFSEPREAGDRSVSASELARIGEMATEVRRAVGDDVGIAFDCHWRFDVGSALAVADAVAPAQPMWLEDPVPPEPGVLSTVTARSPVPIASGENTYLMEGFLAMMDSNAVHVITPDVQKAGGLAESVRIGELAARRYLPVAPHCIASSLGFTAAVHVVAALSNHLCLEFHGGDVPFWNDLVISEHSIIDRGMAHVPTGPGLGVELDLDVVRRYSRRGLPVFGDIE